MVWNHFSSEPFFSNTFLFTYFFNLFIIQQRKEKSLGFILFSTLLPAFFSLGQIFLQLISNAFLTFVIRTAWPLLIWRFFAMFIFWRFSSATSVLATSRFLFPVPVRTGTAGARIGVRGWVWTGWIRRRTWTRVRWGWTARIRVWCAVVTHFFLQMNMILNSRFHKLNGHLHTGQLCRHFFFCQVTRVGGCYLGPKLYPWGGCLGTWSFIILKNSHQELSNEGSNFILSSQEVGHWVPQT